MRTPLLLAALLLVPVASAAWPWEPTTIEIVPARIGERQTFEHVTAVEGGETSVETIVTLLESTGRIPDGFAIVRDVETIRIDRYRGSEWVAAERCHGLRGGADAVRRDLLHGERPRSTSEHQLDELGLLGSFQIEWRLASSLSRDRCDPRDLVGARVVREGERVTLATLVPTQFGRDPDDPFGRIVSDHAVATRWQGRDALTFRFDARGAVLQFAPEGTTLDEVVGVGTLTLADGMPGPVEIHYRYTTWDDDGAPVVLSETRSLVGFAEAPAGAPPVGRWTGARLPDSWPDERKRVAERTSFDDAAFGLSFRYQEAFESAVADPQTGLSAFLARNADAYLRRANYERGARDPATPTLPSDGSWRIEICGATDCLAVHSVRIILAEDPPVKVIRHRVQAADVAPDNPPVGTRLAVVDSHTAERILRGVGFEFGAWSNIIYGSGGTPEPWAGIILSTTAAKDPTRGDQRGHNVWMTLHEGRVGLVFEESVAQTPGAIGILPVDRPAAFAAAPGTDATPLSHQDGFALAVGAAAGLGALALLLKALWGLYARLAPADVLGNPVRAKLYERIRQDPGVHRAKLEEVSGVGNGATRHHLAKLLAHGAIFAREESGYVRYFPTGAMDRAEAAREALLRAGRNREVYALFAERPDASLREAARRLGMSAPSVYRVKRKLASAGLLPARVEATLVDA